MFSHIFVGVREFAGPLGNHSRAVGRERALGSLALVERRRFDNGVVALRYAVRSL